MYRIYTFLMLSLATLCNAATFQANFNEGNTPANTELLGTAVIKPDGGVQNSAYLELNSATKGQMGTLLINAFNTQSTVEGFVAKFKIKIGDGSANPADGMSFSLGANTDAVPVGEDGPPAGLCISFDTYNGLPDLDRYIEVKWNGVPIATAAAPIMELVQNRFVDVTVRMTKSGLVDVIYNGSLIHRGIPVPLAPEI